MRRVILQQISETKAEAKKNIAILEDAKASTEKLKVDIVKEVQKLADLEQKVKTHSNFLKEKETLLSQADSRLEEVEVRITGGTGMGQVRVITDNDADSLMFATGTDLDDTSTFVIAGDEIAGLIFKPLA